MTSIFKDFRYHFSLFWKCLHRIDSSWLLTGCTFFAGGCFLGAVCLIYRASWIFAVLYFLLGILGCIICCFCGFTIFSTHNTEKLPLVSSKSEKLECKTLLSKFSSNDCNYLDFDTKKNDKNSKAHSSSLNPDISCGYDNLFTQINIEKSGEKVVCVDFNSNHCPGICHEQYATGPAPRVRSNRTTKDDRPPQARGTLSFVRKMFRLPSVFKRKNPNPTPQHEIPLREFHRSLSEEETFPAVEHSESVSAEEVEDVRIQIEQSTSEDFLHRTYENLLPTKRLMPKTPQARDSNAGIRQDNISHIQKSVDVFCPYQNIPPWEERRIDRSPSKFATSSTYEEKGESFSPEKLYENVRITRDPPRTHRHYENLSLIRPGLYATVHPGGRYFNIPSACHKSRQSTQVPHTSTSSAYEDPSEKEQYSMKTDEKSLLSSAAATKRSITSAEDLANQTEDIGEFRNPSKDSFHELGVSNPYVNIPSSWWQMTKNQQLQESTENVETFRESEQNSAPNTEIYQSIPEKLPPANVNKVVRDRFSNTPSGAQHFMPLGSDRPCVNISLPSENTEGRTSIYDTSTRLQHVRPSHTQKAYEVEERILPEKPYERSNISPLKGLFKTENKMIFQSDERESTPFVSEGTCFNYPSLQGHKDQCLQIPEAASKGQGTKRWKSRKSSKLLLQEVSPQKSKKREDMALHSSAKDHQADDNNIKTLTRQSNVLYAERLADNVHLTRDPEMKLSDVQNPEAVLDYKSPPKCERYSVKTRSDTDTMNTDKSPTSERRLLSLTAKSQSRVPERHSHLNVSEMEPENKECLPREKILSEATGFSNQSYFRISEMERKHFDIANIYPTRENKTEKPGTEWYRDTESKDTSVFKKQQTDSKFEAENKLLTGRKNTSLSQSDYLYVPSTGSPQKDFIRPSIDNQSSQSTKYKLSPSNLDPLVSRDPLSRRETKLIASEQHSANDQNQRKSSSRDETNIPNENQSKKMLVTTLNTAEEISAEELVSVLQSIRPDMFNPLPLKLPQSNQSESKDYSHDATDSHESERATLEGRSEGTRSEYLHTTEIGSPLKSYVDTRPSRLQRTESAGKNPIDLKNAYDNPTYGKILRSPEKKMVEAEKVLERGGRTKIKPTDVPTSQGSVFCIVGSPKSPTQSQAPETTDATGSNTHVLGRDDPVQLIKSSECKEINVTFSRMQGTEDSAMEQGDIMPASCVTLSDTDGTRIKLEGSPQSEKMQAISSGQKIDNSLSSSISSDSHRLSGRTDGFQKNERTSLPSPTKSSRYVTLRGKDSDDFQTVKAADIVSCPSVVTSQKLRYFEPACGRIRTPVPRYACDFHQNEPQEASATSSGSTNQSLTETKSSQSSESKPSAYNSPQSSPSKVKTQIQVRGENSTPQQRFPVSPKKIILPVIGSSILSTNLLSTQVRSASGQSLRLLSPFKNLHSPEHASRNMPHPETGVNLGDTLFNLSATRTVDPTSPPSASRISTSFHFPSPEKSLGTTRRPFSRNSASKQQLKSVRVPLPETPLTLLRSSENPPDRSHPSDKRK